MQMSTKAIATIIIAAILFTSVAGYFIWYSATHDEEDDSNGDEQ